MTTPSRRIALIAAGLAVLLAGACERDEGADVAPTVTVFAAASLTDAFEALGESYFRETGERVQFSFASSSILARQIEAGAPADIYASANADWMDYLVERGRVDPDTLTTSIGNALVAIAPQGDAAPEPSTTVTGGIVVAVNPLFRALAQDDGWIAVGDPEHVPAGAYARQAFESLDIWEAIEPRLARAQDVRGALTLVERGEASLGVVYATDVAIASNVATVWTFPEDSHDPIVYPFAIVTDAMRPEVERFFAYATGESGRTVFERFGFTVD